MRDKSGWLYHRSDLLHWDVHIQRAVTFSVPHVVLSVISHRLYDGVLRSLCSLILLLYHFSHMQWCYAQESWLLRGWHRTILFDGLLMTFQCLYYSLEADCHRICTQNRPGQYSQLHFILYKSTQPLLLVKRCGVELLTTAGPP